MNFFPRQLHAWLAFLDEGCHLEDEVGGGKGEDRLQETKGHLQADSACEGSESGLKKCIFVPSLLVPVVVVFDALQVSLHLVLLTKLTEHIDVQLTFLSLLETKSVKCENATYMKHDLILVFLATNLDG